MALKELNVQQGCHNTSHQIRKCICTYVQNLCARWGENAFESFPDGFGQLLEAVLPPCKRGRPCRQLILPVLSCLHGLKEPLLWFVSTSALRKSEPTVSGLQYSVEPLVLRQWLKQCIHKCTVQTSGGHLAQSPPDRRPLYSRCGLAVPSKEAKPIVAIEGSLEKKKTCVLSLARMHRARLQMFPANIAEPFVGTSGWSMIKSWNHSSTRTCYEIAKLCFTSCVKMTRQKPEVLKHDFKRTSNCNKWTVTIQIFD